MEGVIFMATSSITRNIVLRDKRLCQSLISALENASGKKGKQVTYKKPLEELKGQGIRNLFGIDK